MRLEMSGLDRAEGTLLVHNIAGAEGHKLFSKGHLLTRHDIDKLRELGKTELYVARLEPGDVRENPAAERIARALAGENVACTSASGGRVNALATGAGVLKVNPRSLLAANSIEGVTVATVAGNRAVKPKQIVATVKTIGLALREEALRKLESDAREMEPAFWIEPITIREVAVILTGSPEARERVERTFTQPIESRVGGLGARVTSWDYCAEEPGAIARAVSAAVDKGTRCILIVGETSIMDRDDITPRGIREAGGVIELYGAPVEPGNLLLLAYRGDVPIVGAPGCVKSRETNVVDLVLPRLLVGERVRREDVIGLADGGLLI